MLKKGNGKLISFLFLFILFLFILLSFSNCEKKILEFQDFTEQDKINPENVKAFNDFTYFYKIWEEKKIKDYNFKINYIAQSSLRGTWEIFVKKGKVIKIIDNNNKVIEGKELEINKMFGSFTIESLFSIASYSYKNKVDALYKIYVKYDETFGFPKEVKKIPVSKDAPLDMGFSYSIVYFEQFK